MGSVLNELGFPTTFDWRPFKLERISVAVLINPPPSIPFVLRKIPGILLHCFFHPNYLDNFFSPIWTRACTMS